ncbi:MAG: TRAP transporter small permease [Syntrophales bacterium]|nr:TRAP transporter small permease [Syntrophales bacterium]
MYDKFLHYLGKLIEIGLILGSVVLVGMVTAEVVLRKGFETSLIITEELARYMLVWLVFLAGALGIRDKSHIRINALVKHLNPRLQVILALCAHGMSLIFLVLLFIESIRILPRQFSQMCITFDVAIFYFYLAIPIGCILMALFLVPKIRDILAGRAVETTNFQEERVDKYTC